MQSFEAYTSQTTSHGPRTPHTLQRKPSHASVFHGSCGRPTSPPHPDKLLQRDCLEHPHTALLANCTAAEKKTVQRILRMAEKIRGTWDLPILVSDIYNTHCLRKAKNTVKDATNLSHALFSLMPSDKRYRSITARSSRLGKGVFPQAVRLLKNKTWHIYYTELRCTFSMLLSTLYSTLTPL